MKKQLALCVLSVLLGSHLSVAAEPSQQWGHWRGPTGNGTAPGAHPPTEFGATQNLLWSAAIPGRSSGSPIVWEDKVFVVTAVPSEQGGQNDGDAARQDQPNRGAEQAGRGRPGGGRGPGSGGRGGRGPGGRRGGGGGGAGNPLTEYQFQLLCLNRADGKILWQQTAARATPHQATHPTNSFASASPCTDGEHVHAHFCSRGLYCYSMDGELQWSRNDLGSMNSRNDFGEGSSPTLAGDLLLVPWDHEGPSFLYAIDKRTGKTVWKTPRDEPTCWATPLVVDHAGGQQVIMNGQNYARAYDLKTGKELWRCAGQTERPAASAVAGNGLAFVGSGYRGNFLGAFRLDGSGDIGRTPHVAWSVTSEAPDIASPLLSGGRLYFYGGRSGILTCVDAQTGTVFYGPQRVPELGDIYASPVAANGFVYLSDRDGTIVVIKDSDEFEVVSVNSIGETIDATPAPVDDQLFVRGEKHLFCFAE